MKNHFKKQVEVQGMKKLDSIKGVQTLEAKDLKEIEGGFFGFGPWGFGLGRFNWVRLNPDYPTDNFI